MPPQEKTGWRGDADFLIKCDMPSSLGDFSYEVLDTKLARTEKPEHIMQLCVYSELLTDLQGLRPVHMHLFLGSGEKRSFQMTDFFYYYMRTKKRFESYLQSLPEHSYPEPCSHCHFCRWRERCETRWEKDDHLSLVANIQRSQMDKLRKADIATVASLATSTQSFIPDLNHDVFLRLRSQAALQHYKATTGKDKYEIIPSLPGKGFGRIPEPDDGDLFFDMEGDPLYPNGLEYLFGVSYVREGKEIFKTFWAHNHKEVEVDELVKACVPSMNFCEIKNTLIYNLSKRYKTFTVGNMQYGGLEITRNYEIIDANGKIGENIHAFGIPTEGTKYFTLVLGRPNMVSYGIHIFVGW